MFKVPISILIHILLLSILILPTTQIIVDYATFCIGSCYNCPASPYQCTYVQSLLYPPANYNCLPYYTGDNCRDNAFGYQVIQQDGLTGWTSSTPISRANSCTIFYQPQSTPKFNILGPFAGGANVMKTVQINRDTIQTIILKMAFTIKSSNMFSNSSTQSNTSNFTSKNEIQDRPQINTDGTINSVNTQATSNNNNSNTISNRTGRSFIQVAVSGPGFSYFLQLNYPRQPNDKSKIVDSTCGVHVQYVNSFPLNISIPAKNLTIKINITSLGDKSSSWGLSKFQINVGCGGLMIPKGQQQCGACMNGFYPIMARQGILMGCAPCKSSCKTCTQDRCTLCQSNSNLNPITSSCQLTSTYINIQKYLVLAGRQIPNINSQNYINNLIISTINNSSNRIKIQSQLKSPSPFAIKFFIIFSKQFSQLLGNRSMIILHNQQNIMNISASQFRKQMGLYDERIQLGTSKYYLKSIQIDKLNQQNFDKYLQIQIRAPTDVRNFYVSNYVVTQYQCTDRCQQCDRRTNQCLQCSNFFVKSDTASCVNCPNGFYLKRLYDLEAINQTNTSVVKLNSDTCVKCYSTCKQCIGPEPTQCNTCFKLFYLQPINYNKQCIKCLYDVKQNPAQANKKQCLICLNKYQIQNILLTISCSLCIKDKKYQDIMFGQNCQQCWLTSGLAYGRCVPTPASGLTFYGSDATNGVIDKSAWSLLNANGTLQNLNCTTDYQHLWGVPNANNKNNVTVRWVSNKLPTHNGLNIIFNIFKIDIKLSPSTNNNQRKSQNLYIKIDNNISKVQLINRKDGNLIVPGANLCADNSNQIIQTFLYDSPTHIGQNVTVQIISEGGGIYVRQLQLFLGNCLDCTKNQLNYQIQYLPRYSYNDTVNTGLDIWIKFNQPIQVADNTTLKQAFKFSLNQLPNIKLQPLQFYNDLQINNRLHYYMPVDQNLQNCTLVVKTNPNAKIFGVGDNKLQVSRRLLINFPLNILSSQRIVERYIKLSDDDLAATTQIYQFFYFFQWFALIVMIICVFLGIGVVFQEFSILLQLLFLHVYISSLVLPATFKAPMDGLQRMENLNYFTDPYAQSIQNQWFKDYEYPSPYIFQQYNKDILFQRSFYPIIIINLIYLIWFIILFVLYKCNQKFQRSQNPIISFFRHIPARPLNYIDQIWRYQFITTIWSAFMQFNILKNNTSWQKLNLAICFISFIISVIWPLFVVLYTYRLNLIKYTTDFMYKYEDIYYLKFQTISQFKLKYYYYILIRFVRYLIMVLFIAVFTQNQMIVPVILICINAIQAIYVVFLRIYYSNILGIIFKLLQNLLFIGIEISILFAYALSNNASDQDFLNLGYAIVVLYVIIIIVGFLRFVYLFYTKLKNIQYNKKMGMDNGEVVKVQPMPLPNTDRGELRQTNLVI